MSYIDVNSQNFKSEVLESDVPVLVDFWAPWCNYCMMLSPEIEELSDDLDGEIKICKLNCDEAGNIASDYSVRSIPCLILFSSGEEIARRAGFGTKDEIKNFIRKTV